jgi:hypothetical protein
VIARCIIDFARYIVTTHRHCDAIRNTVDAFIAVVVVTLQVDALSAAHGRFARYEPWSYARLIGL